MSDLTKGSSNEVDSRDEAFAKGIYPFLIRKYIREYLPDQSWLNIPSRASFVRNKVVPIHFHLNSGGTSIA
jgi:hypothetical protein